jgi:mono/diheme cytochrome c family protein
MLITIFSMRRRQESPKSWLVGWLGFAALFAFSASGIEIPREAIPLDSTEWPLNYRLHLDGAAKVRFTPDFVLSLEGDGPHDIAVERPAQSEPVLRVWRKGELVRGPEDASGLSVTGKKMFSDARVNTGGDFTAQVMFETSGNGTLFSKCGAVGKWSPDAKALFVRDGRLVYDIGWVGALTGGPRVDDGKPHVTVLRVSEGKAGIWLDGRVIAERSGFSRPDQSAHVFKVGCASENFAGDLVSGRVVGVKVWNRGLPDAEMKLLFSAEGAGANTPDFVYQPTLRAVPEVEGGRGWVQALERSDHASIVAGWGDETLKKGGEIYHSLCVVCHGTKEQPGSLPTALRFSEGMFKNGSDPLSMYLTLTKGYGQMVAQSQFTTEQKYAVIHYIRETFLRPHNPSQLARVDLSVLPKGMIKGEAEKADTSLPPYLRMELGNALFWTFEVGPGNIAQKGIAIRLDEGSGGVSKGRAWMVYDHDTMRVAAASTGSFVDWKGIAFDGSHGTHTSLTGERHFVLPSEPGWGVEGFEDSRAVAKDGRRYGPVKDLRFLGLYKNGAQSVLAAKIFGATVLESPALIDYGAAPVFVRTINVGDSGRALRLRVAPVGVNVVLVGDGLLRMEGGFWVAQFSGGAKARLFISRTDESSIQTMARGFSQPLDLGTLTKGGMAQWNQFVETRVVRGREDGAFAVDDFPLPQVNPFGSWMRPGGFDFTPDGRSAVVAMWNGDVWRVDGLTDPGEAALRWRRIASGLFQPLGVKFRRSELFVLCRDQLAKLVDLNGDGETDFIECFNDDAQVTEHFHEFAMGLQTGEDGSFYYAKSGRHALDSVVEQHGTLLRVSPDGASTTIVATGFRAANGVCVNGDGTFFVTDQEGFWTPKNRINRVRVGGFYGNMFGYTPVTDESDSAMEQPLVWVTNAKDRSPAELLWVPKGVWGGLGGRLLNLSYGTGRIFVVPHEEVSGAWQGAVSELPLPAFGTGIMRGRFGSDGSLYTCGMFAWAGNATSPGGFHRVRRGLGALTVPVQVNAIRGALRVTFSDSVADTSCAMKVWSLKRSKGYGSKHYDERELSVKRVDVSSDGRTVLVEIPDLVPVQCYELRIGDHVLHGTIHELGER